MDLKNPISNEFNLNNNARLVDFGGWNMPTFYSSIIEEYKATRDHIGLFDVSHMGRWWVTGKDAELFFDNLISNDIFKLNENKAIYTPMLNEQGGIIDDLIIYKFSPEKYLLVNNCGNHGKDSQWYEKNKNDYYVLLDDITQAWGQIAIQGPKAKAAVEELLAMESSLKYFSCDFIELKEDLSKNKARILVSATGYTGEQGYELYGPPDALMKIWQIMIDKYQAKPCGLGARDLLRLEAGYCLHGNDINAETTPYEAGLDWTVKLEKMDFIGENHSTKINKKLLGLACDKGEKIIPRSKMKVFDANEKEIGYVTSGNFSPNLDRGIALAYIDAKFLPPKGNQVNVGPVYLDVRGKKIPVSVGEPWFYRNIRGVEIQDFAKMVLN